MKSGGVSSSYVHQSFTRRTRSKSKETKMTRSICLRWAEGMGAAGIALDEQEAISKTESLG